MSMKNPPHPSELIREEVIGALNLSITQAAKILDVRRATLSDMLQGHSSLSSEMALRLEKAFGISMDLLLKMQAGYEAAQMRQRSENIHVKRFHITEQTTRIAI